MDRDAVLVVDDDSSIRTLIREALELDGYRVTVAADGAAALMALRHLAPCVILLDLRMPNVNGREFSKRYHTGVNGVAPIVVMSATTDIELRRAEIGAE